MLIESKLREERYIVLKRSDVAQLPQEMQIALTRVCCAVESIRVERGAAELSGVFFENNWYPEYENAWKLLGSRIEGKLPAVVLTAEEAYQVRGTIALLSCMVNSGESHSATSEAEKDKAFDVLSGKSTS